MNELNKINKEIEKLDLKILKLKKENLEAKKRFIEKSTDNQFIMARGFGLL